MRILYTAVDTPIPGTHGGSVHVLELCRALAHRGHDVHIVAPSGVDGRSLEEVTSTGSDDGRGVQLHPLVRPMRFLEWTAGGRVRRLANVLKPDVILDRFYTFGGAGIWAAHSLGLPAVLEVNSPARPYPGSLRDRLDRLSLIRPVDRWRRQMLGWSDAVYATSRHLVPADMQASVTVITNGVDTERFRPAPAAGTDADPLRCVYASSFRSWHGAEDLVQAVATCVARGVDLRVMCIGRGPRWEAARQAARDAGLVDVLTFAGRVPYDEMPTYLAEADIGLAPFSPAAFPALQLGWFWSPIKIFEYLAAGLAVVTIGIEELRDLLPETVARFYAPGDTAGLARQIERLAADRPALGRIKQASRRLAESRFTWNHQAATVEAVLRKVAR